MTSAAESRIRPAAGLCNSERPKAGLVRYRLSLTAAVLLGAVLAFLDSGRAPFWRDEAHSATIANRTLPGTLHVLRVREANMGLYYLLLNVWERIGGTSETWIRAFSALAALAAIPVAAMVAERLVNRPFAMISAFLLATNPWFVIYAREARAYGLTLLLTATATLLFLRAVERGNAARYVAYGLAVSAAEYSQLLAVLIVIPHIVYLVRSRRHRDPVWLVTYLLIAVSFLPLAATVFSSRHNDQVSWIPHLSVQQIGGFGQSIVGGPVAFVVVLGLSVLLFREALDKRDRLAAISGYLALAVLSPVLVVAIVSIAMPLFVGRYLLFILPALAMLTAAGLVRLHALSRSAAAGAALLVLGLFAVADHAQVTERFKAEDIPAAVALVRTTAEPGMHSSTSRRSPGSALSGRRCRPSRGSDGRAARSDGAGTRVGTCCPRSSLCKNSTCGSPGGRDSGLSVIRRSHGAPHRASEGLDCHPCRPFATA